MQEDLISILFPLFLRRRYLEEELCALSNVLRGRYMLPELARLEVRIPKIHETKPCMWPVHFEERQLTPVRSSAAVIQDSPSHWKGTMSAAHGDRAAPLMLM